MPLTLPFPAIDPVLVEFGPLVIRWYALAYVAGLLIGWRYMLRLAEGKPKIMARQDVDDFLLWATLGIILGGRLGYVLFYNAEYFLFRPLEIFAMWRGGMSFHGGLLGVAAAIVLFSRKRGLNLLGVCDLIALVAPIGLFFGRVANFINGELFGRATDVPWAMVFPRGGPAPRHPSQLYEAALEGLVLFLILLAIDRLTGARARHGLLIGVFLTGYGAFRFFVEFFREPDAHLGFLLAGATMGQILSLPLLAFGLYLIAAAVRRP
ncbi:MAG: prolipoprotein diacylglyceryl transferase [Proteobacteria bacterium]|nr:prolipoprotein diacylglyceryl transferase [Pseudomonadota bacterium]